MTSSHGGLQLRCKPHLYLRISIHQQYNNYPWHA